MPKPIKYGILVFMLLAACHCTAFDKPVERTTDNDDSVLVKKLATLCHNLRTVATNFTQAGVITITDKAAKDHQTENLDFIFCKRGDQFYYKLGNAVMLNESGIYLYIDLKNKTILITPQKPVVYDAVLKRFADLAATLKSEKYTISSSESGNEQTISLLNEHHITCKQYALTFDKQSLKISKLYIRLTNISAPLRTDNEKIITARINRWDDTANLNEFLTATKVIKTVKGRWILADTFKNYQLVNM
jgi:hypothetical protein